MTAKPSKMAQYLANGQRLRDAVNAYRAAKGEASAEGAVTEQLNVGTECNDASVPTKPKSQRLPPLATPTELPDYPLNWDAARQEIPDYGSMARLQATRATQAERRGKRAPLKPIGPSRLVKRRA